MKILSPTGVTAGVTSPPSCEQATGRRRRAVLAGLVATGLVSSSLIMPGLAAAAPPTFPDNVVVFPDRDFVTVEGYQDHVGQEALLEVVRGGQVVGAARSLVAPGDVAFEVNHPGGACWGAGTDLAVTPDIRAGDVVRISFNGAPGGDTTVQDAAVTKEGKAKIDPANPTRVTVTGFIKDGVNPTQVEQRIINPDLKETSIGRRDVRATTDGAGDDGYISSLAIDEATDAFTATYDFTGADAADVAAMVVAGGGERFMSWQVEDAAANRQGLTIAEVDEIGGPGMGGCPAGPADVGAPTPGTATVVRSAGKDSMQVRWQPATAVPGAEPVSGYSVFAISKTAGATGQRVQLGMWTPADATVATINGLVPAEEYDIQVRSLAGPRMSEAFETSVGGTPTDPTDPTQPADTTTPAFTSPAEATPESPTIEATEAVATTDDPTAQIYFTLGDVPAVTGDMPSDAAEPYTGPIPVPAEGLTVHFVAIDDAGNLSTREATYTNAGGTTPPPAAAPDAPANLAATAVGQDRATLTWNAVTGATAYQVKVVNTNPAGPQPAQPGEVLNPTGTTISQIVQGLTGASTYTVTVTAKNAAGTVGAASAPVEVKTTAVTDAITIGSARYRAGDRFEVSGTGSVPGNRVDIRARSATGTVIASAAVAADGTWSIRQRRGAVPPTNPGTIYATSTGGGQAGPFTVGR